MNEQFEALKNKYGCHLQVAAALGVTRRTYYNYRNAGDKLPKRVMLAISLLLADDDQESLTAIRESSS
ncbi:MAG TPA: hypothetical protein DCE18_14585 [Syntrophobacteraceae bacterium]|nr:hypothetical protein [Syntrophobacteraceae bacterium]